MAGALLVLLSILAGVAMLCVFHKTSDPSKIRTVKRRLQACLLEFRIFSDEPSVLWRAQKSLVAWNLRYISLMLRPALWMALPLALLLIQLDAFYGRSPLPVGRDAVVTLSLRSPLDPAGPAPLLSAPDGISVDTPPVRVLHERQVSWRVRPARRVSGEFRFTLGGHTVSKSVEAGPGSHFLSSRRTSSVLNVLWNPPEWRLRSDAVDWIDIQYPPASVTMAGIRLHWLVWFTVISMLAALVLKNRFGVEF